MSEKTTTAGPVPAPAKWSEQSGKLKAKFPTLTDADLKFEEGKQEDMFKAIQTKLGKTREELNAVISEA